jgi:SagB-type dehydrogenase family enzyme
MNENRNAHIGSNNGGALLSPGPARAAPPDSVKLPPPQRSGGKRLMEALMLRHSSREFSAKNLTPGVLSNLLWAAFGVNRPHGGGRTAPSAHDWEEIDVYVATAQGLYRYDAGEHALKRALSEDIRADTGMQTFVADAPVNLVYVADLSRMTEATAEERAQYAGPDAGFIAQNVYLFCASEGLATVVRGMVDRSALAKRMKLGPDQRIILAQTVGYPAP